MHIDPNERRLHDSLSSRPYWDRGRKMVHGARHETGGRLFTAAFVILGCVALSVLAWQFVLAPLARPIWSDLESTASTFRRLVTPAPVRSPTAVPPRTQRPHS